MIIIIPCGAKKLNGSHKAINLYVGPYFKMCKRYALRHFPMDRIFILSGKYGLVPSQQVIQTYNKKITDKDSIKRNEIKEQARVFDLLDEKVIALGGKAYTDICKYIWPDAITPLGGVGGIGHQMKWLKEH